MKLLLLLLTALSLNSAFSAPATHECKARFSKKGYTSGYELTIHDRYTGQELFSVGDLPENLTTENVNLGFRNHGDSLNFRRGTLIHKTGGSGYTYSATSKISVDADLQTVSAAATKSKSRSSEDYAYNTKNNLDTDKHIVCSFRKEDQKIDRTPLQD